MKLLLAEDTAGLNRAVAKMLEKTISRIMNGARTPGEHCAGAAADGKIRSG